LKIIFSVFSETTAANATIFGVIGLFLLLNIQKIILSFLKHPNTKVPYKNFVENYIFSVFFETTAANATIFGMIGLFLLLNI
jgi:hypothetical protein